MGVRIDAAWDHVAAASVDDSRAARDDEILADLLDDAVLDVDVLLDDLVLVNHLAMLDDQPVLGAL